MICKGSLLNEWYVCCMIKVTYTHFFRSQSFRFLFDKSLLARTYNNFVLLLSSLNLHLFQRFLSAILMAASSKKLNKHAQVHILLSSQTNYLHLFQYFFPLIQTINPNMKNINGEYLTNKMKMH